MLAEYPYLWETHLHTSEVSACAISSGKEMAQAVFYLIGKTVFLRGAKFGEAKLPECRFFTALFLLDNKQTEVQNKSFGCKTFFWDTI